MGLRDLVMKSVSDAIRLTDDLAEVVTLVKHNGSVYDPAVGKPVESTSEYPGIRAVLPKFSSQEKDDEVVILTDRKCLIAAYDLPAGVVPSENDEIVTPTATWDIRRILGVPGDSLYILHVRKTR